MPDASFAEHSAVRATDLPVGRRLAMIALGYIPLFHAASIVGCFLLPLSPATRGLMALAALFVAPPILSRLARLRAGTFRSGDPMFLRWWFTNQLQVLFNRLPIEELLRLVPGLYSPWLRLWGAEVGSLVYWSPRVVILDRGLIRVGGGTVLGAGARLSAHVLSRRDGELELILAPIAIGPSVIVGAWSLLSPGVVVEEGEVVPATAAFPPHSLYSGGRIRRGKESDE